MPPSSATILKSAGEVSLLALTPPTAAIEQAPWEPVRDEEVRRKLQT